MKKIILLAIVFIPFVLTAQVDSFISKIKFEADFRFRVERDWDSVKPNGTLRDNRTRLRYRVRAGANYAHKWYQVGFRLRTGNPIKQQDPQLTLGVGPEEFGTLQIGLEKAFFHGKLKPFEFWLGKNAFPFEKNNELFWSDNVFPEGVVLKKYVPINSKIIDHINVTVGHFIMSASGASLSDDAYFQGVQTSASFFNKRLKIFPALYVFNQVANIPDGFGTFKLDYTIFHIGSCVNLLKNRKVNLKLDYFRNTTDYDSNVSISEELQDQKNGYSIGLEYGNLKEKGDWFFGATYAYLERFSAVDYMAQNDWARWDYSSAGSPDGRLTNFEGLEVVVGYKIDKKINLKLKHYIVDQLIRYSFSKETGERVRLDLDVKF